MDSARQRVFEALSRAGDAGRTTAQLAHPSVGGVRFGARVKELRDEGHVIDSRLLRPGSHVYVLRRGDQARLVDVPAEAPAALFEMPASGSSALEAS